MKNLQQGKDCNKQNDKTEINTRCVRWLRRNKSFQIHSIALFSPCFHAVWDFSKMHISVLACHVCVLLSCTLRVYLLFATVPFLGIVMSLGDVARSRTVGRDFRELCDVLENGIIAGRFAVLPCPQFTGFPFTTLNQHACAERARRARDSSLNRQANWRESII